MLIRISVLVLTFIIFSCSKEIIQQKLTVDWTPLNGGTVSPPSNAYEKGSVVSLTSTPAGEYVFKQWSGNLSGTNNPAPITMDTDKQVTGVFEKRQYPLSLTIEGSGTVKEEVIAIASQAQYPSGTTVRLTAQPADKFEFGGWSGDLTSTANPLDLKIEKAISLKAMFQQIKFPGYKVNKPLLSEMKSKSKEDDYWKNCGVPVDLIMNKFNINVPYAIVGFSYLQVTTGDFNNDGWIDVFNSGIGLYGGKPTDYFNWFLWNPKTKTFEIANLFSDKSFKFIGENARRTLSTDLNKDGYTDMVIVDGGDDLAQPGQNQSSWQPIRLVLSKSDGTYELKSINATGILDGYHLGDLGDLNNDGNLDLVLLGGTQGYISWGTNTYPYFGNGKISTFSKLNKTDNGFGEWVPEIDLGIVVEIADVNNDGWEDMILGNVEDLNHPAESIYKFKVVNRVALNAGQGRFSKSGLIELPARPKSEYLNLDYKSIDINNDGLMDIVATGTATGAIFNYMNSDIVAYLQQKDKTFKLDTSVFRFTTILNQPSSISGKPYIGYLTLFDYNKDGLIDIGYFDCGQNPSLSKKTVLINKNGYFLEEDYFQYDEFAKTIKP
jgi:hypothetical protein